MNKVDPTWEPCNLKLLLINYRFPLVKSPSQSEINFLDFQPHMHKVIDKSRGEVSLLEQNTIENVSWHIRNINKKIIQLSNFLRNENIFFNFTS